MRFSSVLVWTYLLSMLICAQFGFAQVSKDTLKPFTTDGCSMWIDGPPNAPYLWRHCCVAHDKAYWMGGPQELRATADKALQQCIANLAGVAMADYMYAGVIAGGSPIWITPYRWGYGWSYLDAGKPRGYKLLTDAEQAQVTALMPQAEQTIADDAIKHPSSSKILTGK
jgi:hypothetical protein